MTHPLEGIAAAAMRERHVVLPSVTLDPRGVVVAGPCADVGALDLVINGHRAWSFEVGDIATGRAALYEWAPALRPYLDGFGDVLIRHSRTGMELCQVHVHFGAAEAPIKIADAAGRFLSINKWGHLGKSFENRGDDITERLLDSVDGILADLADFGLHGFVVYGSLLGAIREGRPMPHDDDADVAYLSVHEHPVDVAAEQLRLRRFLRDRGRRLMVHSLGHLQVQIGLDGIPDHYVDIFTMFLVGDHVQLPFHVRTPAANVRITPLGTVSLSGRDYPAPADPESLLAATYGQDWRIPNPAFRFATPPRTKELLTSWTGNFTMSHGYWQNFYSGPECLDVPTEGSPFLQWVAGRLPDRARILEVGSGTGRDAVFLASAGHRVHAVDRSAAGIERLRDHARSAQLDITTGLVNIADLTDVLTLVADLPGDATWDLYARFFLHAIDDEARENFWVLARALTRGGGTVWLEFRTDRDADRPHEFRSHYRNYLALSQVVAEIGEAGMQVHHVEEGTGLAPFRDEDPVVARLVLRGVPADGDTATSAVQEGLIHA